MMIYRETSYLNENLLGFYELFVELKPYAPFYFVILCIAIILSLFFQNSFIKFFIDLMMGWCLFPVLFVGVLIVVFDKRIEIQIPEYDWNRSLDITSHESYKKTKIWGITLVILGIVALYYSNQYKKYYSFQCQTFYLEKNTGIYHSDKDCEYIGMDENAKWEYRWEYWNSEDEEFKRLAANQTGDFPINMVEVKGVDLLNSNDAFCTSCEEMEKELAQEYEFNRYTRR